MSLRTGICLVNDGKPIFADISMLDGHMVVHSMAAKFFSAFFQIVGMRMRLGGENVLCFDEPRFMEFVGP